MGKHFIIVPVSKQKIYYKVLLRNNPITS